MTGGAVELRVLTPCETGVASLLVTATGKRYYFTTENEAPRLHDEEFGKLDFEPVLFPWYADDTATAAAKLAGGPLGSDTRRGLDLRLVNLYPLRAALSETEIARYRWLGTETAAATVESLHQVEPGLSEYDLEAITAADLLRRGILPSVYLYAVDDRIYKYKHAVARGKRLKSYAMLNLCSRKWGLAISITRFLHFGELPAELAARFKSAAQVNAALLNASRVGATSAELFRVAQAAYAAEGFPGEEQFHHQGGPTGLWRARVGCDAERQGNRGQQPGICVEPEHSRRQGRGYGDSARWRDREPDAQRRSCRSSIATSEWKHLSGGRGAGEVRKQGTGSREQGVGSREQGVGNS